jgi:hypothetical protein
MPDYSAFQATDNISTNLAQDAVKLRATKM